MTISSGSSAGDIVGQLHLLAIHIAQDAVHGTYNSAHHLVDQLRVLVQQSLEAGTVQPQQFAVTHGTQPGRVFDTVEKTQLPQHVARAQQVQSDEFTTTGMRDDLHIALRQYVQTVIFVTLFNEEGPVPDTARGHDTGQ